MNMLQMNAPCLVCNKNDNYILEKLRRLKNELRNISPVNDYPYNFLWGSNSRCPYGLHCSKLDLSNSQIRSLVMEIEPYLVAASQSKDMGLYRRVLSYLQGDFPAVYSLVKRIHNQTRNTQNFIEDNNS